MPRPRAFQGAPAIRESLSPWNRDKCILTMSASSPQALEDAVGRLLTSPLVDQLKFDAAHVAGDVVQCYQLEQQRDLRHSSFKVRLEAWLLTNWLALPLVLTFASALMFVGLRIILRHHRQGDQAAQRAAE